MFLATCSSLLLKAALATLLTRARQRSRRVLFGKGRIRHRENEKLGNFRAFRIMTSFIRSLFTGLDLVSRQHAAYDAVVATFPFGTTSLTTRISCALVCDERDGASPLLVLSAQSCSFGKIRSCLQTSANCLDFRLFPPMPEYE